MISRNQGFFSKQKRKPCQRIDFIHEIKTKGYGVIGVNVFLSELMRFFRKNEVTGASYTTCKERQ